MPITYECSRCGARYTVEDKFGGTKARCAKCFEVNVVPLPRGGGAAGIPGVPGANLPREVRRACPECGEDMASNASVCVACGYNVATGQRVVTRTEHVRPAAAYGRSRAAAYMASDTGRDILANLGLGIVGLLSVLYLGRMWQVGMNMPDNLPISAGGIIVGTIFMLVVMWLGFIVASVILAAIFGVYDKPVAKTVTAMLGLVMAAAGGGCCAPGVLFAGSMSGPNPGLSTVLTLFLAIVGTTALILIPLTVRFIYPLTWLQTIPATILLIIFSVGIVAGMGFSFYFGLNLVDSERLAKARAQQGQQQTARHTPPQQSQQPNYWQQEQDRLRQAAAADEAKRQEAERARVAAEAQRQALETERRTGPPPEASVAVPADAPAIRLDPRDLAEMGEEVAVGDYRLRLPRGMSASVQRSLPGARWRVGQYAPPNGISELTVEFVTKTQPDQKRPWLWTGVGQPLNQGGLTLVCMPGGTIDYATITGLPVSRVGRERATDSFPASESARTRHYFHDAGGRWLIVTVTQRGTAPPGFAALDSAARTLRRSDGSSPAGPPLTVAAAVEQLGQGPNVVAFLIAQGSAVEEVVAARLRDADPLVRRDAADVLTHIGTARSIDPLRAAATGDDAGAAEAARLALARIAPDRFNEVGQALLDLRGGDERRLNKAVETLRNAPRDAERAADVAAALETALSRRPSNREAFFEALATWGGASAVPTLTSYLDKQDLTPTERTSLLTSLIATRDPKAVPPTVRAIVRTRPEGGERMLMQLGNAGEDELLKLAREVETVRSALEYLRDLGTARSLTGLRVLSNNIRDQGLAQLAGEAFEAVNLRNRERRAPKLPPAARGTEGLNDWASDPKLADRLGPEVGVGAYAIRPPAGFTATGDKATEVRWESPDGNAALSVSVLPWAGATDAEPFVDIHYTRSQPANSPILAFPKATIDRGRIGGLRFVRGPLDAEGANARRFGYAAFHGDRYLILAGDYRSTDPDTLALLEASARSFRRLRTGEAVSPALNLPPEPEPAPRVREAIAAITALRGRVTLEGDRVASVELRWCPDPDAALAHLRRLGPIGKLDLFRADSVEVSNMKPLSEAGLAQLAGLHIQELALDRRPITTPMLYRVAQIEGLRELSLSGCTLADSDAAALTFARDLRELSVNDTPLSDAAVDPLATLTQLEQLKLAGSRLTAAAEDKVRALLQNTRVSGNTR